MILKTDYEIRAYLRKIKALADRGIDGEADNARAIFINLCAVHGIDPVTFDEDDKRLSYYWFKFTSVHERKLLHQIVDSIKNPVIVDDADRPNQHGIELTPTEAIELEAKYEFYRRRLDAEFDKTRIAFYMKHNIFTPRPGELRPPTAEEEKEINDARRRVVNLDNIFYNKQIK